jgi:hypothetical protein
MWWLIFLAVLLVIVIVRGNRPRPSLNPESSIVVTFDDDEIVARDRTGDSRRVPWEKISRVSIRTTGDGPFAPDVFWGIHTGPGAEADLVFPGGATGETELLREFQRRLPDFRNDVVITAMGSATNAYFVLWEREAR